MLSKLSWKSLGIGLGVFIVISILLMIVKSWISGYVEGQLFGDNGAYSHEDNLALIYHPIMSWYEVLSYIIKLLVPCAFVVYLAEKNEIVNAILFSVALALLDSLSWYGVYPNSAGMVVLTIVINVLIVAPLGYAIRRYKYKNRSADITKASN